MRLLIFSLLLTVMALPLLAGTEPFALNLWPGLAPGETTSDTGHVDPDHGGNVTRLANVTCPQLLVYGLTASTRARRFWSAQAAATPSWRRTWRVPRLPGG